MADIIVKTFRLNNFKGGMNTMAEDNCLLTLDPGANAGAAFAQVKTEFRNLDNFLPINRGGLSKAAGHTLYASVGNTPVTGLYRFNKSDGNSYFLVSVGNTLLKHVTGTTTGLYTALKTNAWTHFETAYDKCIICDGEDSRGPLKFDGNTVATLGGSPPNGTQQAMFYQNRLWLFSATNNQSLLYYSNAGDIEAGYAANFVNCDVNDGQRITAIQKFFIPGQLEPVILVGKERSIGIVTGDGTASTPYTFKKIANDTGIPGFRQMVQFGQDVAFLTPQGISSYQTSLKDVNIKRAFLSANIQDQFTALNPATLDDAFCWYDWRNNLVSFAVTPGNSAYPNWIWHYDPTDGGFYKQSGFGITAAMVDNDGTVYFGDMSGSVFKVDDNVSGYNGSAIVSVAETGFMDFFEPRYYKRIRSASIIVRGGGLYTVDISTRVDYGKRAGSSHTISLSPGVYTWNGGVWTNNPETYQWGGSSLGVRNLFPKGIFRNIAFKITQSGVNQPLELFEINLEVEFLNLY